jgi:hypothetical protein
VTDSRDLVGLGMPPILASALGGVPATIVGTGTTQAAAAAINTRNAILNAQTSQTAFYLPTATASTIASRSFFSPYWLNNGTVSTASPIIFVGLGGTMNGVLNGSITLATGQAAIAWQVATGQYVSVKTA